MSLNYGEDVPFGGTATTTVAFVRIKDRRGRETFARRLVINNEDATNNLLYTTDNGGTFSILKPGVSAELLATSGLIVFGVKSAAATAAWTAHASVA